MTKPILDASDAVSSAKAFLRAIEMTTRGNAFGDNQDAVAMSTLCFAAEDKLNEALGLLQAAVKGEAA